MKKAVRTRKADPVAPRQPAIFYRVNSLLHTVHAIGQYEDHLCSLLHEIKTAGPLHDATREELNLLLDEIPSVEYEHDLHALRDALEVLPLSNGNAVSKKRTPSRKAVSLPARTARRR